MTRAAKNYDSQLFGPRVINIKPKKKTKRTTGALAQASKNHVFVIKKFRFLNIFAIQVSCEFFFGLFQIKINKRFKLPQKKKERNVNKLNERVPGTIPLEPCVIHTFFRVLHFFFASPLKLMAFFFILPRKRDFSYFKTDKTSDIGNGINCEIHLLVSDMLSR